MTNLHDARVEAAAKDLEKLPLNLITRSEAREAATVAIAAADAVVTVDMIAEAFDAHLVDRTIKFDSDGFREWTCMCGNKATADEPHRIHRARAVLALLRGGDGCDPC